MFSNRRLPDQQMEEAHIRRSEKGNLQLEIEAPSILQFSEGEARTVYPKGVALKFYDNDQHIRTSLRANYAISYDEKKVMKARDSVVIVDYTSGDTIYLQDIIWSETEDRIYSNHPLRAVNGQQITLGDGFVSDGRLENINIRHQRGTIEFQD